MTHPISELQSTLISALLDDVDLLAALQGNAVFDAPPKGSTVPHVAIVRHDVLQRDGDEAPGHDHRLTLHCRHDQPSRKAVLAIVERVVDVALSADLSTADLRVTLAQHDRTDTAMDTKTGAARAVVALRFFSEPV